MHYATGITYTDGGTAYDGNFIALNVSCNPSDDVALYAYVSNSTGENGGMSMPKTSPYTMCVAPVIDDETYSGYICVSASKHGYQTASKIYNCSGLTLESDLSE